MNRLQVRLAASFLAGLTLLLLAVSAACAAGGRVLVMDMIDPPYVPGAANGALAAAVKDEIVRGGSYEYVSPDDMIKAWFPGDGDRESRVRFVTFSVIGHAPEGMGTIYEKQKLWPIELMLMCDIGIDGGEYRVRSMLVNVNNGRFATLSAGCQADGIKETIRGQVKRLIARAPSLAVVVADREIDPLNSTVAYDLRSESGEKFSVEVRFSSSRIDPGVEDVYIAAKDCAQGEARSLSVMTREKRRVEFRGTCWNGHFADVAVVAEAPAGDGPAQEILTLESEGGHALSLVLNWKGAQLKAMRISPVSNPYGEVEA